MSHIGDFKDNEIHSFVHYVFPKFKQESYHHSIPQGVNPSDNNSLPFPLYVLLRVLSNFLMDIPERVICNL